LQLAGPRQKVVVIGAGPGGLEAATVAAARGHEVVLFEASSQFGGQLRLAARAPYRTELGGVISYRVAQLRRLSVDVRLSVTADVRVVLAEKPRLVVIATGALPARDGSIAGSDLSHVIDVFRVFEPDADIERKISSASTALVIDNGEGFWETCSAAEALADRGLRVTLVSPSASIGANIPAEALDPLLARLRQQSVELIPFHSVRAIHPQRTEIHDRLRLETTQRFEARELAADIVVVYAGKRAVDELAGALRGMVPDVRMVGDCVAPRRASDAIYEGHRVARSI
jgi:2,4-dienoyl-CoA reductase (NADPH2)